MEVGPVPQVEILLLWCWLSQPRTLDQHFRHTPQGFHKEQCTPLRQSRLSEQAPQQAWPVLSHRKTQARKEVPFIMEQAEAQGELVCIP